jgi:hypothetical protein
MSAEEAIQKEIISLAQQTLYQAQLLIKQCDRWLPEEEGRKNLEKRFRQREKERRAAQRIRIWNAIKKFVTTQVPPIIFH